MSKIVLGIVGAFCLLSGCGSSDGGGSSPQQDCENFLNTYCGHVADCIQEVGCAPGTSRDTGYQACVTAAKENLPCGKAKTVGPSFTACLSDVQTTACTAFGSSSQCMTPPLPADCVGVIGIQ